MNSRRERASGKQRHTGRGRGTVEEVGDQEFKRKLEDQSLSSYMDSYMAQAKKSILKLKDIFMPTKMDI